MLRISCLNTADDLCLILKVSYFIRCFRLPHSLLSTYTPFQMIEQAAKAAVSAARRAEKAADAVLAAGPEAAFTWCVRFGNTARY